MDVIIISVVISILKRLRANNEFMSIKDNIHFVKYQKDINKLVELMVNDDKLQELLANYDPYMVTLIKKYTLCIIFFLIYVSYEGTGNMFTHNIIEFSKNQLGHSVRIDGFFNARSNAKIIENSTIITQVHSMLNMDDRRLEGITGKASHSKAFVIYDVINALETPLTHSDLTDRIIAQMILEFYYNDTDAQALSEIIDAKNLSQGIFKYIDIVIPGSNYIDFSAIKNSLEGEENASAIAKKVYDMTLRSIENEKSTQQIWTVTNSAIALIKNGLLVPIVDDFLLYHHKSETYAGKTSKLKMVVDKVSKAALNDKSVFNEQLRNRRAILINDTENKMILDKQSKSNAVQTTAIKDQYDDLTNIQKYPYLNFKEKDKSVITVRLPYIGNLSVIRNSSFLNKENTNENDVIDVRVARGDSKIDIVGFLYNPLKMPLKCIKHKEITHKSKKLDLDNVSQITAFFTKNGFNVKETADYVRQYMFDKIISNIDGNKILSHKMLSNMKQYMESSIMTFAPPGADDMSQQEMDLSMYYNYSRVVDDKNIKKEDKKGSIVKIPLVNVNEYIGDVNWDSTKLDLDLLNKKVEMKDIPHNGIFPTCQHILSWHYITSVRKNDPNKFNNLFGEFINHYGVVTKEGGFVCKSCGIEIAVKKYITDGSYDEGGSFVTFSSPLSIPLADIKVYQEFGQTIKYMHKLIERIASIANLTQYVGRLSSYVQQRRNIVKDVIDLVLIHNDLLRPDYKARRKVIHDKYGINPEYSNLFTFKLENNIFTYSSQDKDHFKHIKRNNIFVYVIIFMILSLKDNTINVISQHKTCNIQLFEKYGYNAFSGLLIPVNDAGDMEPIQKYKTLCYILYMLACNGVRYKIWHSDDIGKTFDIGTYKSIIHTSVDFINSALSYKSSYHHTFSVRFFTLLHGLFSDDTLVTQTKHDIIAKYDQSKNIKAMHVTDVSAFVAPDNTELHMTRDCVIKDTYPKTRGPLAYLTMYDKFPVSGKMDTRFPNNKEILQDMEKDTTLVKYNTIMPAKPYIPTFDSKKFIERWQKNDQVEQLWHILKKYIQKRECDIFIVDHDHMGRLSSKAFSLKDHSSHIKYIKDHSYFERDVLFYINKKGSKPIEVFYDANLLLLLGYRIGGQYTKVLDNVAYIKKSLSLHTLLKTLGMSRVIMMKTDSIMDVFRERKMQLKLVVSQILRILNRIVYEDIGKNTHGLVKKYKIQLAHVNAKNLFSEWLEIYRNIKALPVSDHIYKKGDHIPSSFIIAKDVSGTALRNYIVNELLDLLKNNNVSNIQSSLSACLYDIVEDMHDSISPTINAFSKLFIHMFTHDMWYKEDKYATINEINNEVVEIEADDIVLDNDAEDFQGGIDALDVDGEIEFDID